MKYAIEFGKSASPVFAEALRIAQSFPGYQLVNESGREKHRVVFDNLSESMRLAQIVRGWKTTKFIADNKEIDSLDYHKMARIHDCYTSKQGYINKDLFCTTDMYGRKLLLPCRIIDMRGYDVGSGKYGAIYGEELIVSHKRIKFIVEQSIRQNMAHCCPDMQVEKILSLVDRIPGTIRINTGMMGIRYLESLGFDIDKLSEEGMLDNLLRDINLGE
ncbi:MAG: hypothetical protein FWH51_01250 [Dehalococcoidia bacterium]|nr:hypothetical protein [Dehalococcoidia bacterium]